MTISSAQLTVDRDRAFDDWGEAITVRYFTEAIDPQTQELVETAVDTEVTAIVNRASSGPLESSVTRHLSDELEVRIKAEELPTGDPTPDLRVIYESTEYDVVHFNRTAGGLVYTLTCQKRP